MGKKGPLWWRESDWLLRGSSAANQILLRHSGPILSVVHGALNDVSLLLSLGMRICRRISGTDVESGLQHAQSCVPGQRPHLQ